MSARLRNEVLRRVVRSGCGCCGTPRGVYAIKIVLGIIKKYQQRLIEHTIGSTRSIVFNRNVSIDLFAFSALTLLVGQQQGQKKL